MFRYIGRKNLITSIIFVLLLGVSLCKICDAGVIPEEVPFSKEFRSLEEFLEFNEDLRTHLEKLERPKVEKIAFAKLQKERGCLEECGVTVTFEKMGGTKEEFHKFMQEVPQNTNSIFRARGALNGRVPFSKGQQDEIPAV